MLAFLIISKFLIISSSFVIKKYICIYLSESCFFYGNDEQACEKLKFLWILNGIEWFS